MKVKINNEDFFQVTSEFLEKESFRDSSHSGVDMAMEIGTPIHSPIAGIVDRVVDLGDKNIGKGIIIRTQDGETVIFGHLSSIDVRENEVITIGEKIGESGNTGNVVGDGHLHLGFKDKEGNFIDPAPVEDKFQEISRNILESEDKGSIMSAWDALKDIKNYFSTVKEEGFWQATYDMDGTFLFMHWLGQTLKGTFEWVVKYNDIVFLAPAIGITFITFFIGANKFTKWIVPSWLAYFATTIMWYVYYV